MMIHPENPHGATIQSISPQVRPGWGRLAHAVSSLAVCWGNRILATAILARRTAHDFLERGSSLDRSGLARTSLSRRGSRTKP